MLKFMLTTPSHILVLHVSGNTFQDHLLYHLHRDKQGFFICTSPDSPWTQIFFQSSGTSPHDLLKKIKSALTLTSVSSISTHGCILSSPMDSFMLSLFKYPLIYSPSTEGKSSLLHTVWNSGRPVLPVRAEVKTVLNTSGFSVPVVTRSPTPLSVGSHFL